MLIPVLLFLQTQYWHGEAGVAISKNAKIIGGEEIDITEAPYQVAFFRKGHILCGGALIAKDIVLTAASCVDNRDNATFYKVRAGSSSFFEGGEYHLVSKFIRHPHTNKVKLINDVALVWLSKPVTFSDKVAVVPMKEEGEEIDEGEVTQVTGWGIGYKPDSSITYYTKLQKVMVQTVNSSLCAKQVKRQIAPQMMCAGTPEGEKGFCYEDYGAPLVHNGKLAGVASWFDGMCITSTEPSQIYTKVSAMRSWIDETIQKNTSNN